MTLTDSVVALGAAPELSNQCVGGARRSTSESDENALAALGAAPQNLYINALVALGAAPEAPMGQNFANHGH